MRLLSVDKIQIRSEMTSYVVEIINLYKHKDEENLEL